MKNIWVFVSVSALSILTGAAFAGPSLTGTRHVVPGVACDNFNNAQADQMTRDHVRMLLPAGGPSDGRYIICPIQAVEDDLLSTGSPPQGNISAFFDVGVPTGTQVSCIIRSFAFNTTHVPGESSTPKPTEAHIVTVAKTAGINESQAAPSGQGFFQFLLDYEQFGYYTATCLLKPGTGLNSIDFLQW